MKNIFILILLLATPVLKAQESSKKELFSINWSLMSPSDKSFANKVTPMAFTLGWEHSFSPSFSAGLNVGYYNTNEKGDTRDRFDGDLVDGQTDRTLTMVPIQVSLRYFPLTNMQSQIKPFVALSGGVQYAEFEITGDQVSSARTSNWAAVFTPEIGAQYCPNGGNMIITLSGFMQQGSNSWSLLDTKNQTYFGAKLGLGFRLF